LLHGFRGRITFHWRAPSALGDLWRKCPTKVSGSGGKSSRPLRDSSIVLDYMALGAEDAAFGQGDDEHLQRGAL
jgi:hypothetical protein